VVLPREPVDLENVLLGGTKHPSKGKNEGLALPYVLSSSKSTDIRYPSLSDQPIKLA
jgi:hypothetical protein